LLGSTRIVGGRYRLVQVLGRGGTATVWRAWDVRLDRAVAVKVLDPGSRANPAALRRLRDEARTVARLAHPNIVTVRDFGVDRDLAFLVMDLVDGHSLANLLAGGRRLPVEQAVAIAGQICQALAAAHEAGVVHRDIKPANILIDPAGLVRVCDFGIARAPTLHPDAVVTATGTVVGTCQFMAPEQATGDRVDARADLYALGCVLYAMVSGAPPFDAPEPVAVLHQHLRQRPATLRDVPAGLDELVSQLLAKNRADRPESAGEVQRRLAAIFPGQPVVAAVVDRAPTRVLDQLTMVGGWPRRRRFAALRGRGLPIPGWLAALMVGAVVMSMLAAFAVLNTRSHRPQAQPAPRPTAPVQADSPAPASPTAARTTPPARPRTPRTPLDQLAALAAALREQADAGQLDRKAARDLVRRLTEVARRYGEGDAERAADKFADVREKLDDLRDDGKLTRAGYAALPYLDQLTGSLAAASGDEE
jgi:eukaryotic-like serine/threonine-protein kinase